MPSEAFQILIPTVACLNGKPLLVVDEKPLHPAAPEWNSCEYYVAHSKRQQGHFYYVGSGNFACGKRVLDQVRPCLELDCELLPITIQGKSDDEYFLIHPLTVIDALPPQPLPYSAIEAINTLRAPPYRRASFERPAIFRTPRFPSSTECIAGLAPAERDFWRHYSELKLSGLELQKVWEQT